MKKPQNQESEKQAVGINHYYAAALWLPAACPPGFVRIVFPNLTHGVRAAARWLENNQNHSRHLWCMTVDGIIFRRILHWKSKRMENETAVKWNSRESDLSNIHRSFECESHRCHSFKKKSRRNLGVVEWNSHLCHFHLTLNVERQWK